MAGRRTEKKKGKKDVRNYFGIKQTKNELIRTVKSKTFPKLVKGQRKLKNWL